jgi:MFS family permease
MVRRMPPAADQELSDRSRAREEEDEDGRDGEHSGRSLSGDQKRLLALLGVPTFALALGITLITTYMPAVARDFTGSTTIIGLIIAGEGLMALVVPLVSGTASDRLRTPIGGRLPFVLGATPVLVGCLVVVGLAGSLWFLALVVLTFFVFYYVAYEPYRALYPDLIPDEAAGRSQSTQAVWRGVGTAVALLGGGALISIGAAAPFLAGAALFALAMGAFSYAVWRRGLARGEDAQGARDQGGRGRRESVRQAVRDLRRLVAQHPDLRLFLYANALWELALSALKTFVFLYITLGLGLSRLDGALVIGLAAVGVLVGAASGGALGDRLGRTRVLQFVLPLYAIGLGIPFFVTNHWILAFTIAPTVVCGGVVMALPYATLMGLMPPGEHGASSGFYSASRGIGAGLGPLLAGAAIDLTGKFLDSTHGYRGMWLVCALGIAASWPFLRRLRRQAGDL